MEKFNSNDPIVLEGKVWALLSYLGILCILPLVLKKENPFVLSHSKQGLVLFVGEVVVFVAQILLGEWLLKLGLFVLGIYSIVGLIAVLKGESIDLFWVSSIADKITI